jgi:hypothetical protein
MAQESKIEVINKYGWRKEFALEKPIVYIGSDERNDIVLFDGGQSAIAPRHAQLLPSAVNRQGYRLVNLSADEIIIRRSGSAGAEVAAPLAPRSSAEIVDGDRAQLGDFTLVFHGAEQKSVAMKLTLQMPNTALIPERSLEGAVTIHHLGNKAAVQFRLELEGLDANSYEIGPGPVLFPNAEKQVPFRLFHSQKPSPPAGNHRITIHATAPDAYPGERASASQVIQITPFYKHKVRVIVLDSPDYRLG